MGRATTAPAIEPRANLRPPACVFLNPARSSTDIRRSGCVDRTHLSLGPPEARRQLERPSSGVHGPQAGRREAGRRPSSGHHRRDGLRLRLRGRKVRLPQECVHLPTRSRRLRNVPPMAPAVATDDLRPDPNEDGNGTPVVLGRWRGKKDAKARPERLTRKQRSEIARQAAGVRWAGATAEVPEP